MGLLPEDLLMGVSAEPGVKRCSQCGTTKTPMWRNNHDGAKTLCNACGVKQQRASNRAKALAAQAGASKPVGSPHATRPSSAEAPGHPLTPEKLTRSISARSSDRGLGLSGKRRSSEHLGSPRSGQPLDSPPSSHAEHKRSCSGWVGLVPPEGIETSSRRRQQGQRGRYKTAASMQGLELHTDPPDAALLSEITAALVVARSPTEGTVTLALMQGRQVLQQTSDSQAPYIGLRQCENFGYAWDCGQGWSVLLRAPQAQDFLRLLHYWRVLNMGKKRRQQRHQEYDQQQQQQLDQQQRQPHLARQQSHDYDEPAVEIPYQVSVPQAQQLQPGAAESLSSFLGPLHPQLPGQPSISELFDASYRQTFGHSPPQSPKRHRRVMSDLGAAGSHSSSPSPQYGHSCSHADLQQPYSDLLPFSEEPGALMAPLALHEPVSADHAGISLSLSAPVEEASSGFLLGAARRLASVGSGSSLLAKRIAGTHFLGDVEAEDDYDPLDPGFLQRIVDPHVSGPASSGEGVYTIMLNPCLQPSDEASTSALQAHGSALADPRPAGGLPHSPVFEEPQMEGYRTVSASTGLAGVLPPAEDLLHGPAPHASPTGLGHPPGAPMTPIQFQSTLGHRPLPEASPWAAAGADAPPVTPHLSAQASLLHAKAWTCPKAPRGCLHQERGHQSAQHHVCLAPRGCARSAAAVPERCMGSQADADTSGLQAGAEALLFQDCEGNMLQQGSSFRSDRSHFVTTPPPSMDTAAASLQGHARQAPVSGPDASHLLAEACLPRPDNSDSLSLEPGSLMAAALRAFFPMEVEP